MGAYDITLFSNKKIYDEIVTLNSWSDAITWSYYQKDIFSEGKHDNQHAISGVSVNGFKRTGSFPQTSKLYFLDFDDLGGLTMNQFYQRFKHLNHEFIAYNSASCQKDDIRFRMILHLDRPVIKEEFNHFWTNLRILYGSLFDASTNYIEKSNACPRDFKNSFNFIFDKTGQPVCVDHIKDMYLYQTERSKLTDLPLLKKYKRLQTRGVQIRKWSGLHDCPFIPKKMIDTYVSICNTDNSGRYNIFYKIIVSTAKKAFEKGYDISEDELYELMIEADANQHQIKKRGTKYFKKSIKDALDYARDHY